MNRNNIAIPILLACAVFATSCSSARKYKSPEIETQGMFRGENPTDTTTIADLKWEDYFSDPMLQNIIREGLEKNFDLNIAYTRIQQAEANLSMARAAFFPSVALVGQVESMHQLGGGYSSNQYALAISSSWEADIWGKLGGQKRAQYAQFLASHTYCNLIRTSLVANLATSYYALMALDEQLRITRETVELLKESVATMEALFEQGMQNAAAVEQTMSLLYNTQVSIPQLESAIWETENAISTVLGRLPGPISRSSLSGQAVSAQLDYGIPAQMIARRPDVRRAELGFRAAFELTSVARASMYPSLTLGTGSMIGFGATTLTDFFKPEHLLANIIGGVTQPIFANKRLRANLKIAEAGKQEALLTFQKTALGAAQEVSNIIYGYQLSLGKNSIRTKQVKSLSNAVYYTQELLNGGEANYLEVISAQQNLLSAQLGQVNDKLEQLQYSVNLYRALGGG